MSDPKPTKELHPAIQAKRAHEAKRFADPVAEYERVSNPEKRRLDPQIKLRNHRIIELRTLGWSYEDIAEELEMNVNTVAGTFNRLMRKVILTATAEAKVVELRRLDSMLVMLNKDVRKTYPFIQRGEVVRDVIEDEDGNPLLDADGNVKTRKLEDIGPRLQVIDRMLKIGDQRARLMGLNAPVRQTLENGENGSFTIQGVKLNNLSNQELDTMVSLLEKAGSSVSADKGEDDYDNSEVAGSSQG